MIDLWLLKVQYHGSLTRLDGAPHFSPSFAPNSGCRRRSASFGTRHFGSNSGVAAVVIIFSTVSVIPQLISDQLSAIKSQFSVNVNNQSFLRNSPC
jgi:hypothetical protein